MDHALDQLAPMRSAVLADLTVVVIRDHFHPAGIDLHDELVCCLEGLLGQPLGEGTKVLIAARRREVAALSRALERFSDAGVSIELLQGDSHQSNDLKNLAYASVRTGWTWHLDSDCVPQAGCLETLLDVVCARPEVDVVSCLTTYGDGTPWRRVAGVVDRGSENISASAALFRTDLLTSYPMTGGPPHTKGLSRAVGIIGSGAVIHFEPSAIVHHQYEGIAFCREFWRTRGFALMWRSGAPSYWLVPRKLMGALWVALRRLGQYGPTRLRILDWLFVPAVLSASMYFAILGMRDCVRGEERAVGTSFT